MQPLMPPPSRKPGYSAHVRDIIVCHVKCLSCRSVYGKPFGGGLAVENPGCPHCGYAGWADVAASAA